MRSRDLTWALQIIAFILVGMNARSAFAVTSPSQDRARFSREFITDAHVRKQVRFWESIFQKYDASSVVIHDLDEPLAMIDVINFDRYVQTDGKITTVANSDQTELVKRYIQRYDVAVARFQKYKEKALNFGPIEQRVFEVYQRDPVTLARLYRGDVKFRGQGGLSDTFVRAAQRAQEYLPYMEEAFRREGLPIHLTRLPFVESMFNLNARSKVGASGIWQFMPDTAREYMSVNSVVDERNSPYKATHAAAQLLQTNFRELGSWPLAITAYNHGRGGMQRASRELGTTQLGKIITSYNSPTFGFASKNFYAEFVAAANTYDVLLNQKKIVRGKPNSGIDQIVLTRSLSIREIADKSKLTLDQIASWNPCINSAAFSARINTPLPQNYVLRVSKDAARNLKKMRLATASVTSANRTNVRR